MTVHNDTDTTASIWWYDLDGYTIFEAELAPGASTRFGVFPGDKFDAYDESGVDLLLMAGGDIYTVDRDDLSPEVNITVQVCEPFDPTDHEKGTAFRWAGCYSGGWEE